MASNFLKFKKEVIFSPLFLLFFLFLGMNSADLQAQKISNYYTSYHQEEGILYYIYENKDFRNHDKSPLAYDLTYHSAKDSITFNFTFLTDQPQEINGIKLFQENNAQIFPVKRIFVEKDKKQWKQRYSAKMAFNDLKDFFQASSVSIQLMTLQNTELSYESKSKRWKKQSAIVADILQIIELNQ